MAQPGPGQARKSVGHSNVLAPDNRSVDGAKRVILALFEKALKRLRAYDQAASALQVTVRYRKAKGAAYGLAPGGVYGSGLPFVSPEGIWTRRSRKHLHANDEATWLKVLRPMLDALPDLSPSAMPCFVGITFSELLFCQDGCFSISPARVKSPLTAVKMCIQVIIGQTGLTNE
jgi:DNA polymerase-4